MNGRKRWLKWLLIVVKLGMLALLVWMIRGTLESALGQLYDPKHAWHVDWPWLLVAGGFYLLGTLPNAIFFSQVIAATDHPLGTFAPVRAFYVSSIGKYMPGKAMVLVLRASMLRGSGVPATIITVGVFYETLTNMAVGSLVALLILLPGAREPRMAALVLAALAMLAVTGLPTLPPIFKFALRFSGLKKFNPNAAAKLSLISGRVLASGWVSLALGWWVQGAALWAVLHALGAADAGLLAYWARYTAVIALSVVAGFLALLPAGVGAREFVTIELLTPVCGESSAVISAILLRLVTVVADVGISSILYFVRPRTLPSPAGDARPVEKVSIDRGPIDEGPIDRGPIDPAVP